MKVLPESFYLAPTEEVARNLIGQTLVVRTPEGLKRSRIVETEAYLGVLDRACHSFGGRRTARNEAIYGKPGTSYVYFIYGMYFCLNAVTGERGVPEAVLIRATEPFPLSEAPPERGSRLETNGPGKLCRFYGIERDDDGLNLASSRSRIFIERGEVNFWRIQRGSVSPGGIDSSAKARDWCLRYYLAGSRFVSKLR
ncbi:MAG: DNA-3-methyladenine glycosylase [Cryobacterium sp.]|nr:DNA-3-methyladenine glycosylase [Oligoflexia bacterium]